MWKLTRHQWRQVIGTLILAIAVLAFSLCHSPSTLRVPVKRMIFKTFVKMPGHSDTDKGKYMITSVALAQARPATYL